MADRVEIYNLDNLTPLQDDDTFLVIRQNEPYVTTKEAIVQGLATSSTTILHVGTAPPIDITKRVWFHVDQNGKLLNVWYKDAVSNLWLTQQYRATVTNSKDFANSREVYVSPANPIYNIYLENFSVRYVSSDAFNANNVHTLQVYLVREDKQQVQLLTYTTSAHVLNQLKVETIPLLQIVPFNCLAVKFNGSKIGNAPELDYVIYEISYRYAYAV